MSSFSTPPLPFGPDPADESSHSVVNGSYYPSRDDQAAPYPSSYVPVHVPPYVPPAPPPPTAADRWWVKSLVALATAAVIAALGWPLGRLWAAVTPRMPVRIETDGIYIVDVYGEQRAAADSWFVLLSIGAGIVIAVIAWIALRRFRGSFTIAALAVGGGVAGWLMWWVGHNVGRAHFDAIKKTVPPGTVLRYPIDLQIKNPGNVADWHGWPVHVGGVLLYLGAAAVAAYWTITLCAPDSTLNVRRRRTATEVDEASPYASATEPANEPAG